MTSICILPRLQGIGGPASFQGRMTAGLERSGIEVHHDPLRPGTDTILVIAGTRYIPELWKARNRGVHIVQRLNGINWTHRKQNTGIKHFVRAEIYNWMMATTRRYLAHEIVYQSKFTKAWWTGKYGEVGIPTSVIYNGAELDVYTPGKLAQLPKDLIRIQITEGHLGSGHELGFRNAISFARLLQDNIKKRVEVYVAGDVPDSLKQEFGHWKWIHWLGITNIKKIPSFNQNSHLFFPCEINASCPNSVIEALACGLPVVGYDTGAIRELVGTDGGKVVPYGAKAIEMEPANPVPLVGAALSVLNNLNKFKTTSRKRSEKYFNADTMVEKYLAVLLK